MIKELSKDLIGKTIYGYPTGNNASRSLGRNQQLIEFKVISVGRKYLEMKMYLSHTYSRADKYSLTGATQSAINSGHGLNAGYHFFMSVEDVEIWKDACRKHDEVQNYFRNFGKPTDKQITQIHEILFGGNDE